MKAIYLDAFSGISGNMMLGALIQAGVPASWLEEKLRALPLEADEFALRAEEVRRNGICSVYVKVALPESAAHRPGHHEHEAHVHRTMKDIRQMIDQAELPSRVRENALTVFQAIAEAEGRVHGRPSDDVAFHEVGAVDSIVDIIGTAWCLEYLGVERIFASRLNTGSGFVRCAHGIMPVPAPAVADLLRQWPSFCYGAEKELTTPTGAALVTALAEYSASLPDGFAVQSISYGAGTWELELPNVLRVYLGEYQGQAKKEPVLLETNIDDMNPQIYGYLYEKLLDAGALDVWTTPIFMKKNRPAHQLSVLVDSSCREACADLLFRETTSIGIRVIPIDARLEAARHMAIVETRFGPVHCKVSAWRGQLTQVSAEYEDCCQLARKNNVPLKVVQREAIHAFHARIGE